MNVVDPSIVSASSNFINKACIGLIMVSMASSVVTQACFLEVESSARYYVLRSRYHDLGNEKGGAKIFTESAFICYGVI